MSPLQVAAQIAAWLLCKGCADTPDRQKTSAHTNVTLGTQSRHLEGIILLNSALQAVVHATDACLLCYFGCGF